MNIGRRNIEYYVDKIKSKEPFAFARYGDGEWMTILGYYGMRNSNGCTFTKELGDDLRRIIFEQYANFDYTLLRIAKRRMFNEIRAWYNKHGLTKEWLLGDFFLRASLDAKLFPLVDAMRTRRILYIGPLHCRRLHDDFFSLVGFVQPPPINAHRNIEELRREIFEKIDSKDVDFVGVSAGLAAKVLIGDIWEHCQYNVSIVDFGSMWDGYFGVPSRSYIRRGNNDFKTLKKFNTGVANVKN